MWEPPARAPIDGTYYVSVSHWTPGTYALKAASLADDYGKVNQGAPTIYAGGGGSGKRRE